MYYPLIRLIAEYKIPHGKTIEDLKISEDDLFDTMDGNVIGYVDYYNGSFPVKILTDLYDGGIFEAIKEDRSGAGCHVVRTKADAVNCLKEGKMCLFSKFQSELTDASDFRRKFMEMADSLIEKWDIHINDVAFDETMPLDEWLMRFMKENTEYRIVQMFEWHP